MNGQPHIGGGSTSKLNLHITHLDHVGPYLKVYGQINRDAALLITKRIEHVLATCFAIEPTWSIEREQALLTPGTVCVFKQTNGAAPGDTEYMRARVMSATLDGNKRMRVEIEYLDYGFKRTVSSHDLMFLKQPKLLQNIPVLCSQYIVLGICAEWDKNDLETVHKLIVNQTVQLTIDPAQICGQSFASVRWKDFDLTEFLVQQKQIGAPVSTQLMLDHCKKLWKDSPQSPVLEYNNNIISPNSALKTPTDLAREQLAARRSLAARLEMQRVVPATTSSVLNPAAPDYAPKQQQQQPLANLTNVIPPQALVNTQKHNYEATNPFNVPRADPKQQVYNYYNVRMNKPAPKVPSMQPFMPLPHAMAGYAPMAYAPARFTPPPQSASVQRPAIQQRTIPAFRTTSLTLGLTYDVHVSYVENGPHLFWVQLKTAAKELDAMMEQIERMRLQPLPQAPEVGSACVARFSQDGNFYRALVSSIKDQRFRVVYVDYGNSEVLPSKDVYQIPAELLQIKPFAFRFALAGIKEIEPIDESMKQIFKNSALYTDFQLTVQPPESVGSMQTCHLSFRGNNILAELKQQKNSLQEYQKADHLLNDDEVEIRYIDSPSNFYVQRVANIGEFQVLMDNMFTYYNINQKVPEKLTLGAPCIVKCDQEWYRAEILRVDDSVIVRHVDFGYEQTVKRHLIGNIAKEHLKMPRQAIKCCLKGFERSELGQDKITDQFEMLAEESNIRRRTFNVRVFRIEPDGLNVVNLLAKNLNVMKKLYKLSMPFDKYLSLEKGQFTGNNTRAESVVSSELDKDLILNSTSIVESEDREHQDQQQQPPPQQLQQQQTIRGKASSDWDKRSSASGNSRDSKHPQQLQKIDRNLDSSFDSQSIGSYNSGSSSPRKSSRQNGRSQAQSPRLMNGNQEAKKNTRFSNSQSPRKEPQQQSQSQQQRNQPNQRSQNAPQGFAQKPQRQKSTLDGGSIASKRSSGVESDAGSANELAVAAKPEKYVSLDRPYSLQEMKTTGKEAASLSWWVSPFQFYIVPKSSSAKYDGLLREMRQFYRQKPHQQLQLKVGSTVVVRQRKNNAILRATVNACNHMMRKYRVFCVDTGSLITVTSEDVWQLEQRFADAPCLAHRCSFHSVVTNYDQLYIVDHMEKFVPVNARVECEFLAKQPISNTNSSCSYTVNVFVNGASLRDTLVKEKFLTEVPPEVRVSLLAGQQVRGKFTSVRDMTNFKIQLDYCHDVSFLCSYDDAKFVKSNPDMARRFKEYYEGKSYAFNVKHVCENNIIYLRPVMPLFKEDRKSFVCSYPVVLSNFKALAVYAAKPYRVFVQPLAIESTMQTLLDDMYEFYEAKGDSLNKYKPGQICAARGSDSNWYRARVVANDPNARRIEVFYIDYGNTEELNRQDIKALDNRFYANSSGFAVEVNLPVGRPSNEGKLKSRLAELLEEKMVTIQPIEVRRNHLIADIIMADNQSVAERLKAEKLVASHLDLDYMRKQLDKGKSPTYEYIETVDLTMDDEEDKRSKESSSSKSSSTNASPKAKKPQNEKESARKIKPVEPTPIPVAPIVAEPKPVSPAPMPVSKPTSPEPAPSVVQPEEEPAIAAVQDEEPPQPAAEPEEDPYQGMETVVLSHCDNPAHFFVHPVDQLDKLNRMQENLQIVSPSLPPLENVVDGADCVSLYSVDKCWYRAKIIDAELMVLQFIDFGNTDCVSDTTDIKQSMFGHMDPFCLPCALPIGPKSTLDWVDAANGIFNESYTKILRYEYLTHGDHKTISYVQLYIEGENVAKKLIADGYAKPLEYVASGCTCYISHVNSICDFYIQLERDSKALELIEMYLRDNEKTLEPLERFEKGSIVAALFEDDELWYRAELLNQLPDSRYEVLFIDYGNTSTTAKCLKVSEEIAKLPSLSKKCSLQLPETHTGWSQEAEAKFAELTGEGELVFTTQLLKPGADHVTIHLMLDEENIIDRLLPLCPQKEPKAATSKEPLAEASAGSAAITKATITQVESASQIYLQFAEKNALADSICAKLKEGKLQSKKNEGHVDDLCVVKCEDDGDFYRARVLELLNGKYRVILVDFGLVLEVDTLYETPDEFVTIPPLAEPYSLQPCVDFEKNKSLTIESLNDLLESCDGIVFAEILDKTASPPIVRLSIKAKNGLDIFEQLQKLVEAKLKRIEKENENSECVISHGTSPRSFYVQLKRNSPVLDLVMKTLQGLKKEQLERFDLDAAAAAKGAVVSMTYSEEDSCYYRCVIKSVLKENDFIVFLVDYGTTMRATEIFQLPREVDNVPPLALHCQLSEIPADVPDTKLEEAFAALLEQHFGEVYEITMQPNEDATKPHLVKLRINYKDFAQELASTVAGVQKPLQVELHNCVVVQYDDPTSFYVQMEVDVPVLEQMTDKLLDAEKELPVFTDLTVGAVCVAQFPEDEVFYRAQIVKVLDEGKCEVHFIDFGNNAVTDKFRQLPEELAKPPRYSKHCELESATIAKCNVADLQSFIDTRFSETFQVEILATKGADSCTHVVRLFYQSTSISEKLRLQESQ
ncbi:maternal protein tudor [Drosophila guanche]|uniref:Blast:Maternal protein tudor n=2 Tax=Drosophila guanche TaxID=7266 RepID=A0A3B0JE04_DROGU|nr:maternal protein tudor [Drosophila guanche]SPP73490.1 blast:Maternal protein tudor [Drosophila guanche]